MHEALRLLAGLEPVDLDWIFRSGREQRYASGAALIVEGSVPEALYMVLEGVFELRFVRLGDRPLARIGPGELVGEMSFLSGEVASASLVAAEDALTLELPRSVLEERTRSDPSFAARFYRSLALVIGRRLRERQSDESWRRIAAAGDDPVEAVRHELANSITAFKKMMTEADAEAIRAGGLSAPTARKVHETVLGLFHGLNRLIGDNAPLPLAQRNELGRYAQRELLPYLTQSQNGDRIYSKPRGYAGDFLTIEILYENHPTGSGRLGPAVDEAILDAPTSHAVRNRRVLLAAEIATSSIPRSEP